MNTIFFELGLNPNKTHIRTIEVLNNAIYMVVNEYDTENDITDINIRKIIFSNNKVLISDPLFKLPESFTTAVNRDLILTKSSAGDALIARMNNIIFESELVVIGLNKQNDELFEQDVLPVDSGILHASINSSGILVVIPYNDDIQTYIQNESGQFSLADSFKDESLPRREFSGNIMLNSDTGHISLSDSSKFTILRVTETAKVEIILTVSSGEFFESNSLFRVALQAGSFVVTDIQSERPREAQVYSYSEEGDYDLQSTFYFSSLNDSWAKPVISYLYGNQMLVKEHNDAKSAYGVLSFDDYFNFTYNRFLEKEYANSEIPWSINHTKLVANNRLLLIADYDARLFDISSTKNFKELQQIEVSLTSSNRHVKEVEDNTFFNPREIQISSPILR